MKSFSLSQDQIARVVAALVAEELGRLGGRHVGTLTAAEWGEDTALGATGAGLSQEEYDAGVARVSSFFDMRAKRPSPYARKTFGMWAKEIADALNQSFTRLSFQPAGATVVDSCVHHADTIFADAAGAANLLHGRRRLLSLVSPHSLLGFVLTILTPNLLRIPSLDVRMLRPDDLAGAMAFGDVVVATPTLWRYIIRENVSAPDNTMGISFGEPMTAELSTDMRHAGFGAQREIYGSTESGLLGWRDSPTDPFVLFDHWRRDGELVCRRVQNGQKESTVTPMDTLSWQDMQRFYLAGRRDGAVQIGAVNVFPDRIAAIIDQHEFVHTSLVRVGKNKGGVNRLIVHIVLKDDVLPNEKAVRDIDKHCRLRLKPHERPSIFHFEAALE